MVASILVVDDEKNAREGLAQALAGAFGPDAVNVETADGSTTTEQRLRYKKVPVKDGDVVKIGETVMVELRIKADNNYTYLAFEDMKPAGFEPTLVKSGNKGQEGFASYMELRDEKVVFFVGAIDQPTVTKRSSA